MPPSVPCRHVTLTQRLRARCERSIGVPVEVKGLHTLPTADARHLRTFLRDYEDKVPAGVLVYTGRETYWLTDRVLAVPWDTVL